MDKLDFQWKINVDIFMQLASSYVIGKSLVGCYSVNKLASSKMHKLKI